MASGAQVGATFATIGLFLTGVICGMFEINRAAQKGDYEGKMKRGGNAGKHADGILS